MIIISLQLIKSIFCFSCNCYRPRTKYDGRLYFQLVCQSTGGRGDTLLTGHWSQVLSQGAGGREGRDPHQDQNRIPSALPLPPILPVRTITGYPLPQPHSAPLWPEPGQGAQLPPPYPATPPPPQVGNPTDRICHGRYASWVFTQENLLIPNIFSVLTIMTGFTKLFNINTEDVVQLVQW